MNEHKRAASTLASLFSVKTGITRAPASIQLDHHLHKRRSKLAYGDRNPHDIRPTLPQRLKHAKPDGPCLPRGPLLWRFQAQPRRLRDRYRSVTCIEIGPSPLADCGTATEEPLGRSCACRRAGGWRKQTENIHCHCTPPPSSRRPTRRPASDTKSAARASTSRHVRDDAEASK